MQTTLRAALAIAILTYAALTAADQARAMPLAAPPGTVAAGADLITRVTMICGRGGCSQVFTRRVQHPPVGFAKRAVPLVIPKTTALAPVNVSK